MEATFDTAVLVGMAYSGAVVLGAGVQAVTGFGVGLASNAIAVKAVDAGFGMATGILSYVASTPESDRTGWGYAGSALIGGAGGYAANVFSGAMATLESSKLTSYIGSALIGGGADALSQTIINGRSPLDLNPYSILWQGAMFGTANLMSLGMADSLFATHVLPSASRVIPSITGAWGMEQLYYYRRD